MTAFATTNDKPAKGRRHSLALLALFFPLLLLGGCEATPDRDTKTAKGDASAGTPEDFLVVDCLLPGQMRKLGGNFTFLTQRRPIKTAQSDCEIRGGEYVSYDRADYSTALRIWLPLAKAGDPAAQTYVGEIYEKGLGLDADYPVAAHWYTEAVKLGYSRAQINLGHLYEKGLGVKQDKQHALNLYRSASGLGADNLLYASTLSTSHVPKQDYETVQRELVLEKRRGDQLRRDMNRVQKELSQQSTVLTGAERELLAAREKLEEAIAANNTTGPHVNASADERELQTTVDSMESYQLGIEQQVANLRRENSELSRSQRALVEQLSGNEMAKKQSRKQMTELEEQMALSRTNLARSEKDLAAARQKLARQRSLEEAKAPELVALQRELEARNIALSEEQVTLAGMESQRTSLAQQLSTTDEKVRSYQRKIDQMQQQLASAKQQLQSSERETRALKAQLDSSTDPTENLAAAQIELEEQNRLLANQRLKYAALKSESESLLEELNSSEQRKTGYERQSGDLRTQLASTSRDLKAAKADVSLLEQQLSEVKDAEALQTPVLIALQRELDESSRAITTEKMNFAALEAQNQAQQQQLSDTLGELERTSQLLTSTDVNNRREINRLDAQLVQREQQAKEIGHELLLSKASLHMERAKSEEALATQADEHQVVVQRQAQDLQQLTAQFESQFELVKSQKLQISELELEAQNYELELEAAALPGRALPQLADNGPMIEIIEPPVVLTRSQATVSIGTFAGQRQVIGKVSAPAGLLSLTVNGQTPTLNDNNLFRASVPLMDDPTPVEVVLIDNEGRRAAVTFSFVDQDGAGSPQSPITGTVRRDKTHSRVNVAMGDYHALIIGNNQYQHHSTLATAVNDARETEKVLREKYRFKTTLLLNANRYQILSALNDLRENLGEDDNLLIYYAGHGKIDKSSKLGYWLPVDADANNNINWISNKAITDILNVIEAKHILVVADSCYAGTLTQTPIARVQSDIPDDVRTEWIKVMAETRARITLTSGGVEPVLDGGGGRHSVFAKAFLGALNSNDRVLEGYTLYSRVLDEMASQSSPLGKPQTPHYAPIHLAGHESGEFFFNPKRG